MLNLTTNTRGEKQMIESRIPQGEKHYLAISSRVLCWQIYHTSQCYSRLLIINHSVSGKNDRIQIRSFWIIPSRIYKAPHTKLSWKWPYLLEVKWWKNRCNHIIRSQPGQSGRHLYLQPSLISQNGAIRFIVTLGVPREFHAALLFIGLKKVPHEEPAWSVMLFKLIP